MYADRAISHLRSHLCPHQQILKPVKEAFEAAISRLKPISSADKVTLPNRKLPPLPWLKPLIQGYRCCYPECRFCAKTIPSLKTHCRKKHGKGCTKDYSNVSMQFLFRHTHSFQVHPSLQNSTPGDAFSRFYAGLDEKYHHTTIVPPTGTSSSHMPDCTPFLYQTGWLTAVEGYSLTSLCRLSSIKPLPQDPHYLHQVRTLGKAYMATIKSHERVEPALLEELTKWRSLQ